MSLDNAGYTIVDSVIAGGACKSIADQVLAALRQDHQSSIESERSTEGRLGHQRKSSSVVGGRNLLSLWSDWRQVTEEPRINELILQSVGNQAGLVRGLYFDKPPGKGWALAMHRDLTIAVAAHQESASPFSKPTRKGGVPHVEATPELLSTMLTLRVHLDPMVEDNGPLVVIPGSHRELGSHSSAVPKTIHCGAGDVFVMRPLLIHGSRACDPNTTLHRRVIHLEIAPSDQLPSGYRWHQFEPLF
ncbi:phytanoyl-CoA dioxygenase family protein [Rubripirellula sp.]|nr:phytanoyl-CoA dioxygenase family protein [Planctomycetaceae bacterium]MDA9856969.1 phytanoyl-CoA dioxygenase family protein [Rubripirellula sp.]